MVRRCGLVESLERSLSGIENDRSEVDGGLVRGNGRDGVRERQRAEVLKLLAFRFWETLRSDRPRSMQERRGKGGMGGGRQWATGRLVLGVRRGREVEKERRRASSLA